MTDTTNRPLRGLLSAESPAVATAGLQLFADALRDQAVEVTEADWQPPMYGTEGDLARVLGDARRAEANATAYGRMTSAGADLCDVKQAKDAVGLERGTFLHAGPPIEWERMSGPLKGALIGAVLFEGLADNAEEAEQALAAGKFAFEPCHHRDAVGPMAGVVSPSMWMYGLRDETHDAWSWCSLNEGLGKVLRYGAYGPEVVDRLHWMTDVLGPILQQSVRATGPFDIKAIFNGTREPATGWVSPVVDGYKKDVCGEFCTFDAAKAKGQLAKAGGFKGGKITLSYNADASHKEWTEATCNSIKQALGVDCVATPVVDFSTFRTQIHDRKMKGLFRTGWQMDYPSIENFLAPLYGTGASSNDGDYSNPEFDAKLKEAAAATDAAESNKLYQEAEAIIAKDMATIPLWYSTTTAGWSDKVTNVKINPFGVPDYAGISLK